MEYLYDFDEIEKREEIPLEPLESSGQPRQTWSTWNKMFVTSCVFAVLLDPLFFYIPIVRDDIKCLAFDDNLKKVTLALRLVTDLFYMLDIIFEIRQIYATSKMISIINGLKFQLEKEKSAKRNSLSCILIDIFAVIPIPQVRELKLFWIKFKCLKLVIFFVL